jgi:hypothetical protein
MGAGRRVALPAHQLLVVARQGRRSGAARRRGRSRDLPLRAAADPQGRGGAIFYDHPGVGGAAGRLVVGTLDPFYHHGSFFMPAASRFLAGLLDWMDEEFA